MNLSQLLSGDTFVTCRIALIYGPHPQAVWNRLRIETARSRSGLFLYSLPASIAAPRFRLQTTRPICLGFGPKTALSGANGQTAGLGRAEGLATPGRRPGPQNGRI